jgi:triphosphoribosyl-dephospho-CoA synthase
MSEPDDQLGLHAQLACIWEATARKPGNVHRFRDFADTTFVDFLASAAAIAPVLAVAPHHSVGVTVAECVRRTRQVAHHNTNLGIALLLAPLAKARPQPEYRADVERVLAGLSVEDAAQAYRAIRAAKPGGLGEVEEGDVRAEPDRPLRVLMALAADRDLIARQYANGFAEVFDDGAPAVLAGARLTGCLEGGIVHAHLSLMARHPDSLIARKRGDLEARESARKAREVLEEGWPFTAPGRTALAELDAWLRGQGHARNPGTTADLIAASLFVLLREGRLDHRGLPWALPGEGP